MENYPRKLKDREIQNLANYISQNTVGLNVLTSTPTDADLKPNTINLYGDNAYIKFPTGKVVTITPTEDSSGTITVAGGGTGRTSHTAYTVLCGGTTSTAAQQSVAAVGSSGQVLTSNGAAALPTFQSTGSSLSLGAYVAVDAEESDYTWNTDYQAATDGFVICYHVDNTGPAIGYVEAADSTPDVVRIWNSNGGLGASSEAGLCFPVAKDEYWKVTGGAGTNDIFWKALS